MSLFGREGGVLICFTFVFLNYKYLFHLPWVKEKRPSEKNVQNHSLAETIT